MRDPVKYGWQMSQVRDGKNWVEEFALLPVLVT
jgi:hypothetical protein